MSRVLTGPLRTPKFDWDHARQLRADGWTLARIAEHCGVSWRAVQRVCNLNELAASRERARGRAARRNPSFHTPCSCGRGLRWHGRRCLRCMADTQTTTVRDDVLRCHRCGEWKPDAEFSMASLPRRRGRHHECKACDAARKRDRRRRLGTDPNADAATAAGGHPQGSVAPAAAKEASVPQIVPVVSPPSRAAAGTIQ